MEEEGGEQEIQMVNEPIIYSSTGGAVSSVNGYTGDVVLTTSDIENTSDYQTGSEVESAIATAIAGKQDTLTAGTNITIVDNVISATGGGATYTAGNGLNLTGTEFSVDTNIIATKQSVEDEATARENADVGLQGQIDAISASSDVTDIVGTKAELNNYDTSTLGDNDIIKVLQDESQNDETTYYRWSTTTQTFTLIGEEGPYYTKSAVDTLLNAKQNTLIAGTNITIASDNTISATDTTYSDFTGTDGTAAGTAGLVPAPATTDAGKFLKADGTWDTAGDEIVTLTSADYNYPTNAPTRVALWLLDDGWYVNASGVSVATTTGQNTSSPKMWLVGTQGGGDRVIVAFPGDVTSRLTTSVVTTSGSNVTTLTYLTESMVVDNLTGTQTWMPLSANQGRVLKNLVDGLIKSGSGAPTTSTAGTVGQLYEDTTNGDLYICTAVSGSTYTWEEVGAGGGSSVNVVQTTGTSQTDVMSQNAVTSMVFADPGTKKCIRIGSTQSVASDSVAIGISGTRATGSRCIAIGYNVTHSNPNGPAPSGSNPVSTVAIGSESAANNQWSTAIGPRAWAYYDGSIALGAGSKPTRAGEMNIGSQYTSYGYNSSNYRLLTGVYDGQSDHDAANVGQLNSRVIGSLTAAPTTSTAGAVGTLVATVESGTGHLYICTDDTGGSYTWQQLV